MSEQRCRICGCTDDCGCIVPGAACQWVEENLCSVCASLGMTDRERRERLGEYLDERCRRFREAAWNVTCAFCQRTIMGETQEETDHTASVEEFHTIRIENRIVPVCRDCRDVGMAVFLRLGRSPEPWSKR